MKTLITKGAVVFIRTDKETKEEFLKAVDKVCSNQNTVGENLLKDFINKNK